MEMHAETAKRNNMNLREESDIREKNCYDLVRQQQTSFDKLSKLQLEKSVIADTLISENENAAMLLRKTMSQER